MKKDYIFNIIKSSKEPLTADDIYTLVLKDININLSTVYRSLNNLVKQGTIQKVIHQDKIAYYELTNTNSHKHTLICDVCKATYSTSICDIESISKKIKKETGFDVTSHMIEFHGVCPKCKKELSNK